jgi:hypothetical protein
MTLSSRHSPVRCVRAKVGLKTRESAFKSVEISAKNVVGRLHEFAELAIGD